MNDIKKQIDSIAFIQAERMIIEKIIRDETWYEGERRGRSVPADDMSVMRKVCEIVRRHDKEIKAQVLDRLRRPMPPHTSCYC